MSLWSKQSGIIIGSAALFAVVIGWFFGHGQEIVPFIVLGVLVFVGILILCLVKPLWAGYVFIFSLPFERLPSVSVGGFTLRFSQVLLAGLLIGIVFQQLAKRQWRLRPSVYFYPWMILLVAILISFAQMVDRSRGLEVFAFIIFTSSVIWVVPALFNDREKLTTATKILFIVTLLISIFGLYQFVGDMIGLPDTITGLRLLYTKKVFGFPRVQATELEPLYLANFLIIPISLALALFIQRVKQFSARWYEIILGLGSLILILTLARGGYLGMIASALVILAGSFFWMVRPKIIFASLGLLLVITLLLIGLIDFTSIGQKSLNMVDQHLFNISTDASTQFRLNAFGQALTAFEQSPVTGIGIGNFGPWVANYPSTLPAAGWAIVNNEPLEMLAETGIIGFAALFLFVVILLIRSWWAILAAKDPFLKALMLGLFAALIGVIVQYQTFSTLYVMQIWTLVALNIATQEVILTKRA